jgi:hypothetical protein
MVQAESDKLRNMSTDMKAMVVGQDRSDPESGESHPTESCWTERSKETDRYIYFPRTYGVVKQN